MKNSIATFFNKITGRNTNSADQSLVESTPNQLMPKPVNSSAFDEVERVNLVDHGINLGMRSLGSALSLENELNKIKSGLIVDIREDQSNQEIQKAYDQAQLASLKEDVEKSLAEIEKIQSVEVPSLKRQIQDRQSEIIRNDKQANEESIAKGTSRFSFRIAILATCIAFVFSFGFYLSVAYSGIVRDNLQLLTQNGDVSQLGGLSSLFSFDGFKVINIHWVLSLLIYTIILGLFYSKKENKKGLYYFISHLSLIWNLVVILRKIC